MARKLFMIAVIGLGGVAVLLWLGFWQIDRLAQKEAILRAIETRIADATVALPELPDAERDQYLPVAVEGRIDGRPLQVLTSRKNVGAGHRLVVPFATGERRLLLDVGFVPQGAAMPELPPGRISVIGNLHWPDERDNFTPDPDMSSRLWFARDVPAMAATLDTEPVLIVRRGGDDIPGITPWPVDTTGIPNDHLGYAITWFSLAAIWLAMTGILVYRMRKPEGGTA